MKKKNLKTFSLGTPILVPEFYDGASWFQLNYSNASVSSVGITGSTGLSVSGSPITTSGSISLTLDNELQVLARLSLLGLVTRIGSGSYASRTITPGTGISISNGDGISGNPTIAVNTNLSLNSIAAPYFTIPYNPAVFYLGASLLVEAGYLVINSTNTTIPYGQWFAYFKLNGTNSLNGGYNLGGLALSMKCTGSIAAVEFEATSSIKKKNILENLETFSSELKRKFDSIDFVKYQWKDTMKEGEGEFFGYIAENVVESFPELVDMKHQEFAPNIMRLAISRKVDFDVCEISFQEKFEVEAARKIKIFTKNNSESLEGLTSFQPTDSSVRVFFEKNLPPDGEIFVYGTFEDVPLVSKTRFHDMVASRVKILINDFNCLAAKLGNLETKMNALYLKN